MRIVSWNMNRPSPSSRRHQNAWDYLKEELRADLVLAQEATPPRFPVPLVYRPMGEGPYNNGSMVVGLRPGLELRPWPRVPLLESLPSAVPEGSLPDSHPGACAVADVLDHGRVMFSAVSLYGSWEMMPGARSAGGKNMYGGPRLHRMLSDLTGLLARGPRRAVVLAGDFNVTSQWADSPDNEASAVFQRLRAWRLVDCITHTRASRPRTSECECPDGAACSHIQTHRSGSQLDYAFVSESVVPGLSACTVESVAIARDLSDHCPIVLDLDDRVLLECQAA
jgi:exonuclease III